MAPAIAPFYVLIIAIYLIIAKKNFMNKLAIFFILLSFWYPYYQVGISQRLKNDIAIL